MAQATRTFRIFVSSTFSDLKEERNALQSRVFPALKKLCEENKTRFQAIDLRWGVREEAGLDQQTMKICLEEIARCQRTTPRPNFLILLGDRYGWRPLPAEVPAREWTEIKERLRAQGAEGQRRFLQLEAWYDLDENALPPPGIYRLKPRRDRHEDFSVWENEVERPLREILLQATAGMSLSDDDRLRYGASATEQEIARGALRVDDADKHVFCFFRTINGLPADRRAEGFRDLDPDGRPDREADRLLEALKAKLRGKLPPANFFDRYDAQWLPLPEAITAQQFEEIRRELAEVTEEPQRQALGALLAEWYEPAGGAGPDSGPAAYRLSTRREALPTNEWIAVEASLRRIVFGEGRPPIGTDHLDRLCSDVERVLSGVIRQQADLLSREQGDEVKKESDDHDAFGRSRTKFFRGRAASLRRIADYVAASDERPLALVGAPGSGKSAVLARAAERAREVHPGAEVVERFVGGTPGSAAIRDLLDKLCRQISRIYGGDEATPSDYRELVQEFPKRLGLATAPRPLILFLDALDQLSDADYARNLVWLPTELPPHVRLVVSTSTEPGDTLAVLHRKLPAERRVDLEEMSPEEADELLGLWLTDAGRTLQRERPRQTPGDVASQWGYVLEKFRGCPRPLYLKLAFEEARRWRSFDVPRDATLAPDIPSLIEQLFQRLSSPAHHGETLVSRGLAYIMAGKNGLTEDELIELLSRDEAMLEDVKRFHRPPEAKLPVVIWSRLYFDLEPYLTERGADDASLLAFYHRQLEAVARARYLDPHKVARHKALATYFGQQQLFLGEAKAPNIRQLSELPYQQTNAELWDDVRATLTDFDFLEAKCTHVAVTTEGTRDGARKVYGGVYELQEDYRRALERFPES